MALIRPERGSFGESSSQNFPSGKHGKVTLMNRLLLLASFAACVLQAAPKSLFYLTDQPRSVRSFVQHAAKIDIVVPVWYSVNPDGLVWGGPNPLVMEVAKTHGVEVMPIIVNPGFNQGDFHRLLDNKEAQLKMIAALSRECKQNGYSGFQFDFEHVSWTDRQTLTTLAYLCADALHQNGLKLSIATVPNAPGFPGETGFGKWIFENWRGAYDLAALAKRLDLICLMTYDEHTRYTPPGPVAGYLWTTQNLDYALQQVPKEKLSLGIPLYSQHWFAGAPRTDQGPAISAASTTAEDARQLAQTYHAAIEWDSTDRASWFYFYRDFTREYVFLTDARTFRERWNLANQRGLQGFCSWVLGDEDTEIWNLLPSRK